MFKLFSMLLVAGVTLATGVNSARACDCASDAAAPAPAQTARASRAPATTAQNGRQSTRRYSVSPAPSYRAPAMRRSRSYSNGPSWNATRKVLGH